MKTRTRLSRSGLSVVLLLLALSAAYGGDAADADSRQPLRFKPLPAEKDKDGDYLVDAFEETLINTYAPFFIFHPREMCWPSSVGNHLKYANVHVRAPKSLTGGANQADRLQWKDTKLKKPKTWDEVLQIVTQKCDSGQYKYEDLYFALPIDKRALVPGADVPPYPEEDFRVDSTSAKTKVALDVYRARCMTPVYRPVAVKVMLFETNGACYEGEVNLDVFAGGGRIPNKITSEGFTLTAGDGASRQVKFEAEDIRAALGVDQKMPNGPTFAWSKARARVIEGGTQIVDATYIPGHRSAKGEWLRSGNGERRVYFTEGETQDLRQDMDFIHETMTHIPTPEAGAEIYAHVYPTADFIVIQYWFFYGYEIIGAKKHEADWGDHIDVVLYRNDPKGSANPTTGAPKGVIPAYRAGQTLTQQMIAMVVYKGDRAEHIFRRTETEFTRLSKPLTKWKDLQAKIQFVQAARNSDPIAMYQIYRRMQGVKLLWRDDQTKVQSTGTHVEAYVAQGSHQLFPIGGDHISIKWTSKVIRKSLPDTCAPKLGTVAKILMKIKIPEKFLRNPIRVLPQTKPTQFTGKTYVGPGADVGASITDDKAGLKGEGATIKIVNVGEITAAQRERLMRYDAKVNKALLKAWGHALQEMSEEEALKQEDIKRILDQELETKIKGALAAIKEDEEGEAARLAAKAKKEGKTPPKPEKKSPQDEADEKVKQVRSKIWKDILAAKTKVKKQYADMLDETLNTMVEDLIREILGVRRVQPQLLLAKTKPLPGGEFIDYPGRWGRIPPVDLGNPLMREDAKHFLNYEIPDDRKMQMLRNTGMGGPVGPGGVKPKARITEFYRDYSAVAKELKVYGMEIEL